MHLRKGCHFQIEFEKPWPVQKDVLAQTSWEARVTQGAGVPQRWHGDRPGERVLLRLREAPSEVGWEGRGENGKCCAGNLVELQAPKVMEERGKGLRRTNIRNKQNW